MRIASNRKLSPEYQAAVNLGEITIEDAYREQYGDPTASVSAAARQLKPTPLPDDLPAVPAFEPDLLPAVLAASALGISERKQSPIDFPAVAYMTALSSLVARHVAIRPMAHSDWTEVPNLWGLAIQRPAAKKSPSMTSALQPLHSLEEAADAAYDQAQADYAIEKRFRAHQEKVDGVEVQKLLKSRNPQNRSDAMAILQEAAEQELIPPKPTRYLVNDTTVEKLADLQQQNPCLLVYRDEAQGFFASLERQGQEAARAYYLEAWSGQRPFKVDRIGRGSTRIPRACVSILGSIQPGPLKALLRELTNRQRANDGLIQRFQLAVWPDLSDTFELIDTPPESASEVMALFKRIAELELAAIGAMCDGEGLPYLRFDVDAQAIFNRWLEDHENRLRSDDLAECMESHLGKYQGMVPSIALILHLAENRCSPVNADSLTRAIAWAEYLEAHAKRIYAPIVGADFVSAKALSKKIMDNSLPDRFSIKDVYRPGWSNLASSDLAWQAVEILEDYDWLIREQEATSGRPKTVFHVNPMLGGES